jgi:hypothetical protein
MQMMAARAAQAFRRCLVLRHHSRRKDSGFPEDPSVFRDASKNDRFPLVIWCSSFHGMMHQD